MSSKISLLLVTLVARILASDTQFDNSTGKLPKQPDFSPNRHVVHAAKKEKSGRHVQHVENQVTSHQSATKKYLDRLTQKHAISPLSSSNDISIHGKDSTNGDRPPTRFHKTKFLQENINTHDIFIGSMVDYAKNFRSVRDTSALSHSRVRGVQQYETYNISNLSSMCPFADICDKPGREVQEKNLDSCCLPCSCSSTCGQIGNCCDKRDIVGNMCHYPFVQPEYLDDQDDLGNMYFIVDKCLDGSNIDCTVMEAASWGSLYPVYDPVSQTNFYNPQCAKCNGVDEFTEWGITLIFYRDGVTNENIRRALRGEASDECTVKFTPPRTMNILSSVCSDKLIGRCNVTGSWKDYDAELEEACLRWHSPVLQRSGYIVFENVYCKLCNDGDHEPEELCAEINQGRLNKPMSHTFTIDYRQVATFVDKHVEKRMKSTENGGCGKGMVKHVTKPECRTVLCPNGFTGSGESCRPLLSKLLSDLFYVQLQLTPTSSDTLLPLSYLRDLADDQREEPRMWFDAQGAPLDYFEVYSKEININNTEYVEELVVRVGRNRYPLSLSKETKTIQTAIRRPWAITLKGEVFQFFVKPYRYASYVPTRYAYSKEHVLNYLILSKETLSFENTSPEDFFINEMIYTGFGEPFVLKKTNFCNRVRLTSSEWIAGFQEIRLNTSKEVFDRIKLLGDSEFDIFLDEKGEPTVEICVEDFNPDYEEQEPGRNTAIVLLSSGILIAAAMLVDYSRNVV